MKTALCVQRPDYASTWVSVFLPRCSMWVFRVARQTSLLTVEAWRLLLLLLRAWPWAAFAAFKLRKRILPSLDV